MFKKGNLLKILKNEADAKYSIVKWYNFKKKDCNENRTNQCRSSWES
jgi:hypothetical protein